MAADDGAAPVTGGSDRDRRRRPAAPPANPQRLTDLRGRARHAAVARTVGVITGTWVLLGLVYVALPGNGYSGWRELGRVAAAMLLVAVVFAWQTRQVAGSAMPELRAVQALGVIIPMFLLAFASIYLSLSNASADSFTEPLDHVGSLYLTVTVFATVGFGDITPVSHTARVVAIIQMILDLAILGFAARVVFGVARRSFDRETTDGD